MLITISIIAREGVVDQDLLTIDVREDLTIADLKAAIQSDTNVLPSLQHLFHNGVELQDEAKTLEQCHVQGGTMLAMKVFDAQSQSHGGRTPRPNQPRRGVRSDRNYSASGRQGPDAETIRLQALGHPRILAQIRAASPDLAEAVSDPVRFREKLQQLQTQQINAEAERQRELDLLNDDPFNPEMQAKIEEAIRQERVIENLQNAMDFTPEAFGRVHMLYIPVEVNGIPLKAFVDSGAQATIMSPSCAEKCNIMRLIDKRYAGIARGVGVANILGRVHSAQIKIGKLFFSCSFTVMEGKDVDLLLGLDMLKRHQACIDLFKGALIIGDEEVKFLGEADIPRHEESLKNEPSVAGPSGNRTGAVSGVVSKAEDFAPNNASKGKARAAAAITNRNGATSSSASPSAASEFPQEAITKLMDLGFSRDEAIQSLRAVGGNVEEAASLLLLQ